MMIRRGTAPGTSALKVQSGHYYHRQMLWEQGDKSTHNLLFLLLHMPQQSSESCPALCRNQKSYLVLNLRATAWLLHTSWCYLSPCKRTEITSFSSSSAPLCPQINQLQQPLLVFSNKLRFFFLKLGYRKNMYNIGTERLWASFSGGLLLLCSNVISKDFLSISNNMTVIRISMCPSSPPGQGL